MVAFDTAGKWVVAPRVQVQLSVPTSVGPAMVLAATRDWFTLGLDTLGGGLRDKVQRAVRDKGYLGLDTKRRTAGAVTATCSIEVNSEDESFTWQRTYSAATWQRLLDDLEHRPSLATFSVHTWVPHPDAPRILLMGSPALSIHAYRPEQSPDWLLLQLAGTAEMLVGTPQRQDALLAFLRHVADRCGPTSGEVSLGGSAYQTGLEAALGLSASDTLASTRHTIRGYAWLTIISTEIGQRLGGVNALRATGAFYNVAELDNGGLWLQATPAFQDYDMSAAERVFEALASALPPGKPAEDIDPRGPRWIIVPEDPLTRRRGG